MAVTPIYGYPEIVMGGSEPVQHDAFVNAVTGTQPESITQITERELNKLNTTKLTIYAKIAAAWEIDSTTIIRAGEFGIATDTGEIRFGNGVNVWSALPPFRGGGTPVLTGDAPPLDTFEGELGQLYLDVVAQRFYICRNVTGSIRLWEELAYFSDLSLLDYGDMKKEIYDTNGNGVIDDSERLGGRLPEEFMPASFEETDPTVPNWAKELEKPTYTATEVGAAESIHASQHFVDGDDPIAPSDIGAAEPSDGATAILLADNWTGEGPFLQTVTIPGLASNSNGVCGVSMSATDEQFEAAAAANLRLLTQGANELTVAASGEQPNIDIPIDVVVVG